MAEVIELPRLGHSLAIPNRLLINEHFDRSYVPSKIASICIRLCQLGRCNLDIVLSGFGRAVAQPLLEFKQSHRLFGIEELRRDGGARSMARDSSAHIVYRYSSLLLMRWGLIPSWAKDSTGAARMINARSETASAKPAYRDALKARRCLIPADGFYEWVRTAKPKQPYCFEVNGGELFAFAGLWDGWKDPNGNWIRTCSILTTTPNAVTSPVHDRMPVIVDPDSYDLWLDPGMQDVAAVSELMKPYAARLMRCYPVSTRINHVANDDEGCSRPVELVQNRLFA